MIILKGEKLSRDHLDQVIKVSISRDSIGEHCKSPAFIYWKQHRFISIIACLEFMIQVWTFSAPSFISLCLHLLPHYLYWAGESSLLLRVYEIILGPLDNSRPSPYLRNIPLIKNRIYAHELECKHLFGAITLLLHKLYPI